MWFFYLNLGESFRHSSNAIFDFIINGSLSAQYTKPTLFRCPYENALGLIEKIRKMSIFKWKIELN